MLTAKWWSFFGGEQVPTSLHHDKAPQGDTHVLEHQSPAISTCFSSCLKFLDILDESTWELHQPVQVPTNTFLVGGKAKNNSESF